MTSYKPQITDTYASKQDLPTPDDIYWTNFVAPVLLRDVGEVTAVAIGHTEPLKIAVTCSSRVKLYDSKCELEKTFSRFKAEAFCGRFRKDDQLLVAGCEDALVRLLDLKSRSVLRTFRSHTSAVHMTEFDADGLRVISGGDDKKLIVSDIGTAQVVYESLRHTDFVRSGVAALNNSELFLSGGYDQVAFLHDFRVKHELPVSLKHGSQVESVLMFPSNLVALTAGGPLLRVWDIRNPASPLLERTDHAKAITSLCFASNFTRVISAGLDMTLKIRDVELYEVVHSMRSQNPVLDVAIGGQDRCLLYGMTGGLACFKARKAEETKPKKRKRPNFHARRTEPPEGAIVVSHRRKPKLPAFEDHLRAFEHAKALSVVLQRKLQISFPENLVSVIRELIRRGVLPQAISGQDDQSLLFLLEFIKKQFTTGRYVDTLLDLMPITLNECLSREHGSTEMVGAIRKLRNAVGEECRFQEELCQLTGPAKVLRTAVALQRPIQRPTSGLISKIAL